LIGGEDAFVMTARDYTDFARAMRQKLEREIGSVPVTENTIPGTVIEARAGYALRTASNSVRWPRAPHDDHAHTIRAGWKGQTS